MSGFTPGPWVIETTENPHISGAHWRQVCAGEDGPILGEIFHDLGDPDPGLTDADAEANARLIAAAPSLYADAEFLCARIRELEGEMRDDDELSRQYFGHVVPALARMESALAQARGETL